MANDATPAPDAQPPTYTCPGLDMPEPEGWVSCYRAGHSCPPKVVIRKDDEHGRLITMRCPCCGDFGGSMFMPHEWFDGGAA